MHSFLILLVTNKVRISTASVAQYGGQISQNDHDDFKLVSQTKSCRRCALVSGVQRVAQSFFRELLDRLHVKGPPYPGAVAVIAFGNQH